MIILATYMKLPSLLQDSGLPICTEVTSCPCSSRLDGRLPTAALLLGRNNGRRAAIG